MIMAKKTSLQGVRIFSMELKKEVVKEIEHGRLTMLQACRMYDIKSPQTVYLWLYKFSRTLKKGTRIVLEKDSVDFKIKELEKKLKEMESVVGRKQLELDLYKNLVDIAKEKYSIDLKKTLERKHRKTNSSYRTCKGISSTNFKSIGFYAASIL
jgi:transposase